MKQIKKVPILIFVAAMVAAMSTGCTTSPDAQSSPGNNQESSDKKLGDSGYY